MVKMLKMYLTRSGMEQPGEVYEECQKLLTEEKINLEGAQKSGGLWYLFVKNRGCRIIATEEMVPKILQSLQRDRKFSYKNLLRMFRSKHWMRHDKRIIKYYKSLEANQ